MRGANSVSFIDTDKNNVISPLKKIAIKKKVFKKADDDFCFIVVIKANSVTDRAINLYFALINGRVEMNCLNKSFSMSKNFSPH